MDLKLTDRTVVITGGGSNIGRAITLAFAGEGARVAILDVDLPQASSVAETARMAGAREALPIKCDVTHWDEVEAAFQEVREHLGPPHVLVNNVGWTIERLFVDKPREEWSREIDLNLWSVINCTRAALETMVESGGSVISIGSDAGRIGEFREAVYSACKGGVIALSKALAREYGKAGVRFNVVCPGTTMPDTDEEIGTNSLWASDEFRAWNTPEMRERIGKAYPLRRVGRPGDIAGPVVFLASGAAGFITGQTLSVSGGYSMA